MLPQGLNLEIAPVNSTTDAVMAAQAQVSKRVQAFFAMPDNTVFAAFEGLKRVCDQAHLPIFASEAGLVARGALATHGADFYAWGRQVGAQAVQILEGGDSSKVQLEEVAVRKHVVNRDSAIRLGITMPAGFEPASAP